MTDILKIEEIKDNDMAECDIDEQIAQELVDKIQKMVDDRDRKCAAAKKQLVSQLEITASKYRTATGVMEGLRIIQKVIVSGSQTSDLITVCDQISCAKDLAMDMVKVCTDMHDKAESLGWAEMDQLCESFYDEKFAEGDGSPLDMCYQLMVLDLCQNVGPAAEDIVAFLNHTDEEIKAANMQLDDLCEKRPELRNITPTSKE